MTDATRNLLEQHFDTAFAAPGGIAKLRELILTLAMQGKLVEQDKNDPPASELLKEIKAEKERLIKTGKIKKPKPLPPIKPEEVPYGLPQGWEWVRLGEIGIINPRNDAEDSATAGFVPMPLIPEGYSDKHQFEERPWSEIKKGYTHFADGDVGMAKITPCFENAKSCIFSDLPNGIGAGTTELHIFRNSFNSVAPRFLLYYLKNPNYISRAASKMTGSAGQKRVPTPYFTEQLFPLPPLPEQQRIVARIDQLMARCDALETLHKEREEKRLAVHAAAIKQLIDTPDASAWDFIEQHFGTLYSVKENLAELRKAILQLAVMGRLVPQNPNDPPASELLKEIKAEKQRLVKEGKIKKPKPLLPVTEAEKPYALPKGWEWVRLGNIGLIGSSSRVHQRDWRSDGVPFYRAREIVKLSTFGFVKNELFISEDLYQLLSKNGLVPEVNDLMITGVGTIGVPYLVKETDRFYFKDASVLIFKNLYNLYAQFLCRVFKSSFWNASIHDGSMGTTVHTLTIGRATETIIPLPPIPEQHRIVAKIDELMALCDTLEQQIDAASGKQTELLNAVMAQI